MYNNFAYPKLMGFFKEISDIPRGSFDEGKIADYLCDFAEKRGLAWYRDEANNVLISMQGSEGRENEPATLLQGHTDMVCEKRPDVEHDFLRDGIQIYVENGWLRAKGTTLGADNGVAVAIMLYVLDGALDSHGPIECLFTSAEEVGLVGAKRFDYTKIKSVRMINMDSADDTEIIAGCAGGSRCTMSMKPSFEQAYPHTVKITLGGLAGGHSGEDIDKLRANANRTLARILLMLSQTHELRLVSFSGGNKDNAIARDATALVSCKNPEALIADTAVLEKELLFEMSEADRGFFVTAAECERAEQMFDLVSSQRLIFLLTALGSGVLQMNTSISSLVEFSRNNGVVRTQDTKVEVVLSTRSSMAHRIRHSTSELKCWAEMLGMSLESGEEYPGWSYSENSALRSEYERAYSKLFGITPKTTLIHAGLECGIIKERLPHIDMISCGAVVRNLHSPDEALELASFERFFAVIKEILEH